MVPLLLTIIAASFLALLFLNFYFRAKVLKVYRRLVNSGTDIKAIHIFDKKKLEKEVLVHHPEYRDDILTFVNHIRYSVRMATLFLLLIIALTTVLWYFREV